jgi:hypothetical protein
MPGRRWASNLPPLPREGRPLWHWGIFVGGIMLAFALGFAVAILPPPDFSPGDGVPANPDHKQLGPAPK